MSQGLSKQEDWEILGEKKYSPTQYSFASAGSSYADRMIDLFMIGIGSFFDCHCNCTYLIRHFLCHIPLNIPYWFIIQQFMKQTKQKEFYISPQQMQ